MNQKVAFVFPGQGSQSVGMLNEFAELFPLIKELYRQASDVLDYDLWQIVAEGPPEKLNQTQFTQPAMLVGDVAVWNVWLNQGGYKPAIMAGHSLGEYAALVCANALTLKDAVLLISKRAKYMQEAVEQGQGAMAVILGLSVDVVHDLCQEASENEVVEPVNYNSPGQIVIAGNMVAVERAIELAKKLGARRALKLPVSVPAHSKLMKPAADRFVKILENIALNMPEIPVINNVDVDVKETSGEIKDALIRQLYSPVRWIETIEVMFNQGVRKVIECGPGKVLTGLNKRINFDLTLVSMNSSDSMLSLISEEN